MSDAGTRPLSQALHSEHGPQVVCILAPAKRSEEPYFMAHTDASTESAEGVPESNFTGGLMGARHHSDELLAVAEVNSLQELPDIILCGSIEDRCDDSQLETTGLPENPTEIPARVRFRSRVRITSGLKRHRHQSQSDQDYLPFTPSSSISGSPSSSISAPLRTPADDDVGKPGWGTLGQRVSILAQGNSQRKKFREQRTLLSKSVQQEVLNGNRGTEVNERTPLTRSSIPVLYLNQGMVAAHEILDLRDDESDLSREIDLVFGPWPTRLWNHHWWWWKLEPIMCCHWLTESDDEGT